MDAILVERLNLGEGGLRVALKDSIDIAGYATRLGSRVFADREPATKHAEVVLSLLEAGCRIVGKANMHELAYGVTGVNAWSGTPVNPRWPKLIPGGSSSGSAAAVAAGLCDFALGTDTGGSIRVPAACCGVYGLKPSYGRVSRTGVQPVQSSLDCVGPFADSLDMIERAMAMLDPSFLRQVIVDRPRLGVVAVEADKRVQGAIDQYLEEAGADLIPIDLPSLEAAFEAGMRVIAAENRAAFGDIARSDQLGADVAARLLHAEAVTAAEVRQAEKVRGAFATEVDHVLEGLDALVLPTMPDVPLTLDEAHDAAAAIRITALTRPFNLSGHPALSIPLASPDGLPVGLQLVGRRGEDARLCAVARALDIPTEDREQDDEPRAG